MEEVDEVETSKLRKDRCAETSMHSSDIVETRKGWPYRINVSEAETAASSNEEGV